MIRETGISGDTIDELIRRLLFRKRTGTEDDLEGFMRKIIIQLGELRMKYAYATSLFNMFGVPMVVMKTIQDILKGIGINIPFTVLFIVIVVGLLVMGWILDKIGLYEAERTFEAKRNNELQLIKRKLKI